MKDVNMFDNIGVIKKVHPVREEEFLRIMKGKALMFKGGERIKKTFYVNDCNYFIYLVSRMLKKGFHIPVWKIIIPCFRVGTDEWNITQGSIYYLVHGDKRNLMFRGTYGYWGTGPHESAKIEQFFERMNIPMEIRSGDYLLSFLSL